MIGMIALAGIIVRNSILLVDFIQLAEARGAHAARRGARGGRGALPADRAHRRGRRRRRTRDGARSDLPGLAVALMSGAVVATLLTMVVVPLLYWELRRRAGTERRLPRVPHEDGQARQPRREPAAGVVAA